MAEADVLAEADVMAEADVTLCGEGDSKRQRRY